MSELKFFLCGGTGINIGKLLQGYAKTDMIKSSEFVGLDSSGNNSSEAEFPIERMMAHGSNKEETRGSGKVKATNYPQAMDFIDTVLAQHKPGIFNIIVANTSGGTGSVLSIVLLRRLIEKEIPVVLCLINDFTSKVEMSNAIGSLRSLAMQTSKEQLDSNINYMSFDNTTTLTRGQVNAQVVEGLNRLSIFLTETNEEQDYQDIKNLLYYSKAYNVPAALSRITFFDQKSALEAEGLNVVAVSSLYTNRDNIIPRFPKTVIRSTGVLNPKVHRPEGTEEIHMVLDHGEALEALEKQMTDLEVREAESKKMFVTQKQLTGGNDLGLIL